MATGANPTATLPERWRPVPVGYRTDLPVLLATLTCWVLLPVYLAHLATGLGLIVISVHHLRTRLPRVRRVFRRRRHAGVRPLWHRIVSCLLLLSTLAMAVSGLLRWAGIPPEYAHHASSGYAMLTMAVIHMLAVARPLRARLRTCALARRLATHGSASSNTGGARRHVTGG